MDLLYRYFSGLSSRRRNMLFVLFGASLLLLMGACIWMLTVYMGHSATINNAGRQRMRSQIVAFRCQKFMASGVEADVTQALRAGTQLLDQHQAFIDRAGEVEFAQCRPVLTDPESRLNLTVSDLRICLDQLQNGNRTEAQLEATIDAVERLLPQLEHFVDAIEASSSAYLKKTWNIQAAMLVLVILLFVLQSKFVVGGLVQQQQAYSDQLEVELARVTAANKTLIDTQSELEVSVEQAHEARRAKDRFLANMSHEIRTPLNIILGHCQLAQMKPAGDPAIQSSMATIYESGQHLLGLINSILTLSRAESGVVHPAFKTVQTADLEQQLEQLFASEARTKGLAFEVCFQGKGHLVTDPDLLKQVLVNLVSNALKFTERGYVRVEGRFGPDEVRLSVADSGMGIHPDDHAAIFKAYEQRYSGETKVVGTGLGLSICASIVEILEGRIEVESAPNAGAVFTVCLPSAPSPHVQPQADANAPGVMKFPKAHTFDDPVRDAAKILVVDDNVMNLTLCQKLLEGAGFDVRTALSGHDGVQAAKQDRPDLVFMDIQMPELDGYDTTRLLKSEAALKTVPVVALSAANLGGLMEKVAESGMVDFLSKPYPVDQLFGMVAKWIGVEYIYDELR